MNDLPPLPPGFVMDGPAAPSQVPPLPPGFHMDAPQAVPPLPPGFRLDQNVGTSQQVQTGGPVSGQNLASASDIARHAAYQAAAAAPPQPMGAVQNAATAAFHGLEGLGNAGLRAANRYGLISDETAQRGMQNQLFYPEENRLSAKIGGGVGQAALMTTGAAAPLAFAIEGGEAAKERQEQRMATGEQIAPWRQASDVASQEALGYALGKFAPGGKLSKVLGKSVAGGVIGRTLTAGGIGAAENTAQQVAGNASAKYLGGEKDRALTEGVKEAAVTGGAFGGVAHAGHEAAGTFLSRMRSRSQSTPDFEGGGSQPDHAQPPVVSEQAVDRAPEKRANDQQVSDVSHTPESRLPGAATEAPAQTPPDNRTPAGEAARPAGGETVTPVPASEQVEGHPARLDDVDALTDWYKQQNPTDQTGDLIKTMAPHTPYVQAEVPVDHVKPLSDGNDIDRGKVDALKAMTPEQRRALGPAILGPDGEVFDGNHRAVAAQEAGDTHLKAFVPEDAVGTNGIKALSASAETAPTTEKEQTPIQQLLAKGREATEPAEGTKPKFGSPEWAAAMQRATEAFKQRGRKPTARPGFVALPDSKFAERDVKPAAVELASAAKKSLGAINRFFGTGASWSTGDRDSANRISAALSEHDRAMAQAEHTLAPHREAMENWSDKAKAQWVDQVEATGHSPDPKHQDVADFNNTLNEQNIKEGKLYGLNTKKWEGDYIGRLAEFPDDKQAGTGGAGRTTMAGAQNFLKGRVFDTFSEFKKFVEDHGGKLKYDNPMDMLLAKQTEIQRSIMARKAMYTEDNRGQLKWVPDGEKPPEGFDRALRDPLAGQERRQILPSQMVARIAQMDHYAAKSFLEGPEVQKSAQYLRPGTDLPKGYSYSGETQTGTYHGNPNVADQFNNLISSGLKKDVPILHQAAAMVKGTTSMALNLSGVHYAIESIRNASLSASRAVEAAVGGDFPLAAKNLKLMNPLAANKLGAQYREQYANPSAHPQLESHVQGSVEGGAPFSLKSVLDKNHFEDMQTEWKAGNKVGAGLRMVKGFMDKLHGPLFNHFVPNLKAAAAGMAAAQAESKGLTGLQKQRYMSLAHDNIENNLGMVARNRQFQNRIVTDVQDLVMLAPKFAEGMVRNAGAAVRDTATALKDVAQGKKAEMTPAMYTAVAHLVTHATLAALTQVAYTTATTGKPALPSSPMDLLKPRTGRKDDQGRDERLTLPTPVAMAYGLITGGGKAITSRVAPIWHTLANEASNVDENNVEIRHKGDSFLKQLRDSAAYAVKGSMPFSVQNIQQGNRPGQPHGIDKSIGEAIGVHTSYVPSSKAEQEARSALFERGRANPMTQTQYERQQERGRIGEEFTGKNPQASKDLADDLKSGKLAQSDRVALMKQRKAPEGLTGELKKMQAEQIMDRVWPKMTAEEKQKNQWLVRGMVGRSTTLTGAQKQELWAKIKSETAGAK